MSSWFKLYGALSCTWRVNLQCLLKSRGKVGTINISQLFAAFRELASSTSHGTGSSVVIEAANWGPRAMTSITHVPTMLFKEWHSNLSESVAGGPATGRLQVQVTDSEHTLSQCVAGRNKSAGLVISPLLWRREPTFRVHIAGRSAKLKLLNHYFAFCCTALQTSCKLLSIMADQDPQTRGVW